MSGVCDMVNSFTCVIGGPTLVAWPNDQDPIVSLTHSWRLEVITSTAAPPMITCKITKAVLAPGVARELGLTKAADEALEAVAQAYNLMQPYVSEWTENTVPPGFAVGQVPYGWFPRLRAQLHAVGTNAAGAAPTGPIVVTTIPLFLPSMTIVGSKNGVRRPSFDRMSFYWPGEADDPDGLMGMPPRPTVGTQFDLLVYSLEVTKQTPLFLAGHVADILQLAWEDVGEKYDAEALDEVRARRPTLGVALRLTEPPTQAQLEQNIIGGPFGVAAVRDDKGRKRAFLTRTRPTAPG